MEVKDHERRKHKRRENQPEDCRAREERFGQRSKGFCRVGSKKLAYKPTMKPGWDEVSSNSGRCRWSARKIGPPKGDVAAGSPKGETGKPLSRRAVELLIANRRTIEPSGSCAANRQAIKPLSRQADEPLRRRPLNHRAVELSSPRAIGQSSRQAVKLLNHQAIQPSSRQAGEPSSRQLTSRQAEEPSSHRSVKPLIR